MNIIAKVWLRLSKDMRLEVLKYKSLEQKRRKGRVA